jgi:hypothetical protein
MVMKTRTTLPTSCGPEATSGVSTKTEAWCHYKNEFGFVRLTVAGAAQVQKGFNDPFFLLPV